MKTALSAFVLAAVFTLAASLACHKAPPAHAAATGPTYTEQWTFVQFIGSNPVYAGTANATGAPIASNIFGHYVNDADPTDSHDLQIGGVNFDPLAPPYSTQNVTAGGVTVTNAQLYALLNQSITDQWNASQATAAQAKAAKAAAPAPSPVTLTAAPAKPGT